MLTIYNSLSQKKEVFIPQTAGKIKMYVCGMTVYDYCHLGHARMLTSFDIVVRYLRWVGYDVTYVRNITDIDDKIIQRAQENNEPIAVLTERFIQAMHDDIARLHLLPPTHEPRATDTISQMITMIEKLIVKGHAYSATNGDVYYQVRTFPTYGCLSHRNIDQLESGARVEVSAIKRDPLDFVLWKKAKANEPSWPSPWGDGRPGWHIECSAMSHVLLGETVDIHGGGIDLLFPHHENEIAQTEALTEQKFVNYWLHNGHVQVDKAKMSKSVGNFLTLRTLLNDHPPEVIRYALLSSHYRSPLHYSEQTISQAHDALRRLYGALRHLPAAHAPVENNFLQKFKSAMDDDFNTPTALAVLFDLARESQRLRETDMLQAASLGALLQQLGGVLGILQDNPTRFLQLGGSADDDKIIVALIAARNQARAQKDWAEADRLRDKLIARGVILEDNAAETTWRRE